jgi:hypothetical protein
MSILHIQTERRGTVTMSTITSTSHIHRNSLLRSIVLGGLIIGIADAIIYHWFVSSVLEGYPLLSVYQYMASGALGNAAFEGGIATALLGVFFHFLVSFVVAGVFILSADRIPLLRRYVIVGSLLYGIGVFIVMNFIVLPLSAAPPLPLQQCLSHCVMIWITSRHRAAVGHHRAANAKELTQWKGAMNGNQGDRRTTGQTRQAD